MAEETKERPLAEQPYIGAGVDELRKQRLVEYSQYVAKEPIFIGGALAFTEGHPVPATHVRDGIVDADQVERVATVAEAKKIEPPKA